MKIIIIIIIIIVIIMILIITVVYICSVENHHADHQEVFFSYSYTKFVFNFHFEKSLIKYVFLV